MIPSLPSLPVSLYPLFSHTVTGTPCVYFVLVGFAFCDGCTRWFLVQRGSQILSSLVFHGI